MASMHFWGVEVKGKEPSSVKLEEGQVIHVSQATLSELKKDNEPVIIHVKVGDKKLVMGILSQNNPQLSFDLVFDQDFEISHNWKNGTVHLLGYDSELQDDEEFSDFSDEDEDIPTPVPLKENGKPAAPAAAKVVAKPNKDNKPKPEQKAQEENDDDSDDDDDSEDDDDSDEEMLNDSDDGEEASEDDDDDDDSSEEEDTPKAEAGKKRSKPDAKTPEPKKAKLATPQKTDGKKGGGHTATPHPSKKGAKTPGGTPKSGSQVSCGSCKKTFNSETALQSHNKAKHNK